MELFDNLINNIGRRLKGEPTPLKIIPDEIDPELEIVKAALKRVFESNYEVKLALHDRAGGILDIRDFVKRMMDNNRVLSISNELHRSPDNAVKSIVEYLNASGRMMLLPNVFKSTVSYEIDAETISISFRLEFEDTGEFLMLDEHSSKVDLISKGSAVEFSMREGSFDTDGVINEVLEYFDCNSKREALLAYAEYANQNFASGTRITMDTLFDLADNWTRYPSDVVDEMIQECETGISKDFGTSDFIVFYATKVCNAICYSDAGSVPPLELKFEYDINTLELEDYTK